MDEILIYIYVYCSRTPFIIKSTCVNLYFSFSGDMPFLDNPTTTRQILDNQRRPILGPQNTSPKTPQQREPPSFSQNEPYNQILDDVLYYHQTGGVHDSYHPYPWTPIPETSTKGTFSDQNDISNMLHGMSFHDEDTARRYRIGPQ